VLLGQWEAWLSSKRRSNNKTTQHGGQILQTPDFSKGVYDGGTAKMFVPQQVPQDALVLQSRALSEGEKRCLFCEDSWIFHPLYN